MPMRKYEPNDRDREIVLRMAAIPGVTRETIAFCITNDRTGRAINRRTLEKHYAKELETAKGVMQNITMKSFVEQIVEHSWPATRLALSNYCGLKDGEMIANVTSIDNNINVRFVPSPYANEPVPGVDHYDMDLKAAKPDELPPPAIPIAYQSKPIPQEPPNRTRYRTRETVVTSDQLPENLRADRSNGVGKIQNKFE